MSTQQNSGVQAQDMQRPSKTAIINSALWSAYGDALAFMSELADASTLRRRIHADRVSRTISWSRGIGGRFGATIELPAGCYSDDTQLRLATSRAIRADGYFDVEVFAKIELPVWLSYSLGGGTSTKTAASSLTHVDVNWFSNFFSVKRSSYLDGGGNGAAMRIQPHVWAAGASSREAILRNVLRNSVCTHGHPRGIAGACFHALCLLAALQSGDVPGPTVWREVVAALPEICAILRRDNDLAAFWVPVWQERSRSELDKAFEQVRRECMDDIAVAEQFVEGDPRVSYERMAQAIGALKSDVRGSGTKTSILACALSWLFRNESPAEALVTAANLLDSDTDTIATMAGAISGAVSNSPPDGDLLDREYIEREAVRLWEVSTGEPTLSFEYPDLLKWRPPKTMLDAVGLAHGSIAVVGLGEARTVSPKWQSRTNDGTSWQWLKLPFGQTVLAKQREALTELTPGNLTRSQPSTIKQPHNKGNTPQMEHQPELFTVNSAKNDDRKQQIPVRQRTLDELTTEAIKAGFNYGIIGKHVMELAERSDGIELAIAYVAVIAKAKKARLQAQAAKKETELKSSQPTAE